jgi:hypothetical protein
MDSNVVERRIRFKGLALAAGIGVSDSNLAQVCRSMLFTSAHCPNAFTLPLTQVLRMNKDG